MKRSSRPVTLAGILLLVLGLLIAATGPAGAAQDRHRRGPAPISRYVALGDSYTAAPFVPTLQVAGGCYRSTNNYPSVVARSLPGATFVDRSCSGAQTKDMTTSQLPGVAPQLADVTSDTDLVTIGVGGNDFSVFGTLVGFCPTLRASDPTGSPCRDAMRASGHDMLFADIAQTEQRLETVLRQVHQLAPHARVLVVGYPEIAPRNGTCPALLPLADGDYRYANQVNLLLDLALLRAAVVTRSTYVDVWQPSRGHDICSADPWINGQVTDQARAQAFHPFANEEAAVGALVLHALR